MNCSSSCNPILLRGNSKKRGILSPLVLILAGASILVWSSILTLTVVRSSSCFWSSGEVLETFLDLDVRSERYDKGSNKKVHAMYKPVVPINVHPTRTSKHPKWKLWEEMSINEQQVALNQIYQYLNKYGKLITSEKGPKHQQEIVHGECKMVDVGKEGNHRLCGPALDGNCTFLSFGINNDPSFDKDLGKTWKCRGFAGDPTVTHPSKLHDLVTFHSLGATILKPNEERLIGKGGSAQWWEVSLPSVRRFLKLDHIDILKIDCEGCEIAWARDILAEDPGFLFVVDQISVETHVTRTWMDTDEHVYYFGLMFALLEEAGFVMEWSSIFGCSKRHEVAGCMPSLLTSDFPCGYQPWKGRSNVVKGYSCQDFLFRREPTKALM